MRKTLIAALALLLALCTPALAFDFTRFDGVGKRRSRVRSRRPDGPTTSAPASTPAGSWAQFGRPHGRPLSERGPLGGAPLIVVSFTTDGTAAEKLEIRTDAREYEAACTDLTQAGMSAVATEAPLLVTPESAEMLADVAASSYARVTVVGRGRRRLLLLSGERRGPARCFSSSWTSTRREIAPMLSEGSTLSRVYDALTPAVAASEADDLSAAAQAIRTAEYAELKNGGFQRRRSSAFSRRLADLGYLDGGVDGIFGKNTAAAVEAFQQAAGLEL